MEMNTWRFVGQMHSILWSRSGLFSYDWLFHHKKKEIYIYIFHKKLEKEQYFQVKCSWFVADSTLCKNYVYLVQEIIKF